MIATACIEHGSFNRICQMRSHHSSYLTSSDLVSADLLHLNWVHCDWLKPRWIGSLHSARPSLS